MDVCDKLEFRIPWVQIQGNGIAHTCWMGCLSFFYWFCIFHDAPTSCHWFGALRDALLSMIDCYLLWRFVVLVFSCSSFYFSVVVAFLGSLVYSSFDKCLFGVFFGVFLLLLYCFFGFSSMKGFCLRPKIICHLDFTTT